MTKITTRTCGIASRAEFDEKINEIATLDVELRSLTAEQDAELQAVRDRYGDRIEAKKLYRKSLFDACDGYAARHQEEVLKRGLRSGETALARYGFNLGNPKLVPLKSKITWKSIVANIKARGAEFATRYLHTKVTEEANKELMKAELSDAQLAELGARVEQVDAFWVAPKDDNAPENCPS